MRDAVLLSLVPGGADVADLTAGGTEDEAAVEVATARAIARVVDPRVGVPPDRATADAARLVLEQVVGAVPRRWHAAPLALLGFLAWWRGDGWLASRRSSPGCCGRPCRRAGWRPPGAGPRRTRPAPRPGS